ncbi:HEAT repeat domain-containing protein [Gemmata sp. JC717]|uniref:HEAT repeat domain-containing protein n=1 Tax=Gemmata algarum TaxID=2975278 RepID=UPI0021BB1F31|nr:HEAT repeat domain-containing protein [Gemmata algarum]MDY3555085.1 HEAT repeat domain-containing protein [Gemmata algarum]
MRTLIAASVLTVVAGVAAVPATGQPAPESPKPHRSPSEAELDALVSDARNGNGWGGGYKLVALGSAAVPALTRGLWGDTATRRACVGLLAQIGPDARAAAPSLVRLLGDENPEVRAPAARVLGAIGAHRAVPALTKLLDDPSALVRLSAAEALITLDASAGVVLPVLTKALKAEQPDEAHAAARLLADLGPEAAPAVPAIIDRLADASPLLTGLLADALGRIGPGARDALPALRARTKEGTGAALYRTQAALALWRVDRDPAAVALLHGAAGTKEGVSSLAPLWRIDRSKEAVAALERWLKAEDSSDVMLAAETLGTASDAVLPALLRLLKGDSTARALAVPALGELGPAARDALEPIRQNMNARRRGPRLDDFVALYRIAPTPAAARAITDLLEDESCAASAAEALKELRPAGLAVVIELLAALDASDEHVRFACAVALWRIERHPRALPAMIRLLRSNEPRMREAVATDIGREFGPDAKAAAPELVKRLFDPFASVRAASAGALGRVGPDARDAFQPLLAVLDGDEPALVQAAAVEALGLIRPADSGEVVDALKRKLKHPDALVRAQAALALLRTAGDRAGERELEAALEWRAHPVRITAAEAAWLLNKDARVVPLLIRALEESNLEGTRSEDERRMAVRALGRIGADAKDAAPELVKLAGHRDAALAAAARAALKAIDPEAAKGAGVK